MELFELSAPEYDQRFALAVEYNGQNFNGWQAQQSSMRTVQGLLEQAIAKIANHPVRLHCAGRTDAGVHACRQVIHFDTNAQRPLHGWLMGINTELPRDISVNWIVSTDLYFHARFSAQERSYRYLVLNQPASSGLLDSFVTWVHRPLRVELMQEAADLLLGQHDFSAFRAADCQAHSPIKNLLQLQFVQQGPLIALDARANSFLYHMVRNLMGSLLRIGKGERPVEWIAELLQSKDRRLAAATALANGLYFTGVRYDEYHQLPSTFQLPLIGNL